MPTTIAAKREVAVASLLTELIGKGTHTTVNGRFTGIISELGKATKLIDQKKMEVGDITGLPIGDVEFGAGDGCLRRYQNSVSRPGTSRPRTRLSWRSLVVRPAEMAIGRLHPVANSSSCWPAKTRPRSAMVKCDILVPAVLCYSKIPPVEGIMAVSLGQRMRSSQS